MFLIAKMALVTCGFYLGIAVILEIALLVVSRRGGGVMYTLAWWHWLPIFAIAWLISFGLAWLVFMRPFISSIIRPPVR